MQLNGGPMSVEKTIKEFYDKVGKGNGPYAEGINRFAPTAPTSKLIQIARDRKAERILDIGCGMGISIIDMAKELPDTVEFWGIDINESMIMSAKENISKVENLKDRVHLFTCEAEDIPLKNDSLDMVFSECVFNLLPNRRKTLADINRILRKGGVLAYSDYVSFGEVPDTIKDNKELSCGCQSRSISLSSNVKDMETFGFVNIECLNYEDDKKKRAKMLEETSEEIRLSNERLRENSPEISKYLEENISYYLLLGEKLNKADESLIQENSCCCGR